LLEKISVLESAISKNKEEKEEQNVEREKLVKLNKSLQDDLNESESNCTKHLRKRQELEKRNIMLAKQVSDFEQIVIVERNRFAKEREKYDKEILDLTKKASEY
jgi:hypothetical protein